MVTARLLTVTDLHWHSGLEYTLQAIAVLRAAQYDVHLRIVGNGGFLEAVVWARRELKLESSVEILTRVRGNLTPHFRWADLCLQTAVFPHTLPHLRMLVQEHIPGVLTELPEWKAQLPPEYPCAWVAKRAPQAIAHAVQQMLEQ